MAEVYSNTYSPPDWLDKKFLESALREGLRRGSLNVNACIIRPATNVGDNFLSQMFRASAVVDSKRRGAEDMSIIIKSLPKGELVEKFVEELRVFTKETKMLSETLPLLQNILDDANVGRQLSAKMYYQQGPPKNLIILEDLCQAGFKPADRLRGLDLDHSILVMEGLAAFHASSLVALKNDPNLKDNYLTSIWHKSNEKHIKTFIPDGLKSLAERVEIWGGYPDDLPEKIRNLKSSALMKMSEATEYSKNELNVLNHGDSWTSNFMFRYENDIPIDMRFVDFQLSFYGPPTYDLAYFIFASPKNELKISHLEFFLKKYHEKLVEICELLNYPLDFTFEDLKQAFHKRLFLSFIVAIVVFPFTTAPSDDVTQLNDFLDENAEQSNRMYLTDNFKEAMKICLPYFLEKGLFD